MDWILTRYDYEQRSDSLMLSSCPSYSQERRESCRIRKPRLYGYHAETRFCLHVSIHLFDVHNRLKDRARFIYKATKQHALNLAKFVTIYKTVLLMQRRVANGGKEKSWDTFIAGLVGGWFVFGNRNAVNEQVSPSVVSQIFPQACLY